MNKKNLVVLLCLVLLMAAAVVAAVSMKGYTKADEDMIIITVDGKEYKRVPLSQPQTVTIAQDNGEVNVVEVSDHGAVMASSTCKNQQCVHMGEVTVENWEYRPNQAFIICLPNRVSVELAVKQQSK
ncbi:MAG: NusG domain II-containing protein [Clostridia bacterium]|nr:NusG domain II-containing protein [Clostridia bacterium]